VIADLNLDAAQATAEEIKGKGGDAFAVAMNVIDEDGVNKGVAEVMAKYRRIDLLVSNAGIQVVHPLVDFPYADWKKLLSIHLDGAFLTTKACLKHMYAATSGAIVYMGSVHSKEASRLNTVDGEFTTTDDVADCVLFFAGAKTNALTGQSIVVSHGWFMQ